MRLCKCFIKLIIVLVVSLQVYPSYSRCTLERLRAIIGLGAEQPTLAPHPLEKQFKAATKDLSRIEKFDKAELEDFLAWVYPGVVGEKNLRTENMSYQARDDLQVPYATALMLYKEKHLLNSANANQFTIKSFDDLIRFGLFKVENGKLVSLVHLQGNNLAALKIPFPSPTAVNGGLVPTGANGTTTYFRPAGNTYSSPNLLMGYVGRGPLRFFSENHSTNYSKLGILLALDPARLEHLTGQRMTQGQEEGQVGNLKEFIDASPRVFIFDPEFEEKIYSRETNQEFRNWLASQKSASP